MTLTALNNQHLDSLESALPDLTGTAEQIASAEPIRAAAYRILDGFCAEVIASLEDSKEATADTKLSVRHACELMRGEFAEREYLEARVWIESGAKYASPIWPAEFLARRGYSTPDRPIIVEAIVEAVKARTAQQIADVRFGTHGGRDRSQETDA
jgi:hypothetical protein